MTRRKIPWNLITLLIGIVSIVIATYVAYDIHKKEVKNTKITIMRLNKTNPLLFLDDSVSKRIAFLVDGKKTQSLYIYNFNITNSGENPIHPQDFVEPLKISVNKPWEILDIKTTAVNPSNLAINWTKKGSNEFEMVPCLINPDDLVSIVVLINNPEKLSGEKIDFMTFFQDKEENGPKIQWNARIVNLKTIDVRQIFDLEKAGSEGFLSTTIMMSGWDTYWYVLTVLMLFLLGHWIARKGGRLQSLSIYQVLILIFIMLFSLSVAEIAVDLLIHKNIRNQWQGSWLILILNLLFYFFLISPTVKHVLRIPNGDRR